MPKEKSSHALASKSKSYSYKPYSSHGKGLEVTKGVTKEDSTGRKDWEDATCPICMDVPHNAVLLFCTSHDKGCRPYMCNTSYRHSNCLDQYKKAHMEAQKTLGQRGLALESALADDLDVRIIPGSDTMASDSVRTTQRAGRNFTISATNGAGVVGVQICDAELVSMDENEEMEKSITLAPGISSLVKADVKDLVCPLCRGKVNGWFVVDASREDLNLKARSCAQESCLFVGTYEELRVHARCEHPLARPSEIDPARQDDWRRMERQRDLGDVLSSIHSAMPGATIFGDYVIEDEFENDNDDVDFPGDDGHLWTVFLLFQVFGPAASIAGRRGISPRVRGHLRGQRRGGSARLGLWGENLLRSGTNEAESLSGSSDAGEQTSGSTQRWQRNQCRNQGDVS